MSPFNPASIPSGAISVLGPFQVAYDTAGLTTGPGVVLYTFRARTLVITAFVFVPTIWAGPNAVAFEVTTGPDAAATGNNYPQWSIGDLRGGGGLYETATLWPISVGQTHSILASAGDVLGADAFGVVGMTAGVAQVYALVASL